MFHVCGNKNFEFAKAIFEVLNMWRTESFLFETETDTKSLVVSLVT